MGTAALSTCCAILAASLAVTPTAGAAEIRVLSTGAPAEIVKHLAAKFAPESGHRILVTVANPATILQKLSAGETPDIVVAPASVIDSLVKSGTLLAGSRVDLARVGVGVVVREGARRPRFQPRTRCGECSWARARSFIPIRPAAGRPEPRLRA
jgi:molybdate transport system substrate-binding protein